MRHCCKFDAFDIWYLNDSDEFTERVLFIGDCPICKKHVSHLYQKNIKSNVVSIIKKIGDSAISFSKKVFPELIYSRNSINKMNLNPKPYGWKYGVNKEKYHKNGKITLEQYSADFYGNKELIKKNDKFL